MHASGFSVDRSAAQFLDWQLPVFFPAARTVAPAHSKSCSTEGLCMTAFPDGTAAPKLARLQHWLKIDPQQKPIVYAQVCDTAQLSSLNYWLEIVFSAGIAALGLVLNSPAVIIGGMLISPLMGPIMAAGLALAAGDLYLAVIAVANLVASVSLSVAFSAFIVWLLPFHSVQPIFHWLLSEFPPPAG